MIPRMRPGPRPAPDRQRGSMAVEFAVAVPGFLVLLLLVAAGGNWVSSAGQVGAAASDAVRAASVARSGPAADAAATAAANYDLGGVCAGGDPRTTVTPVGSQDFAGATDVQVEVECTVDLQAFKVIGFPATVTFTRTAVAPLDPFVQRQ